jgi:deazaflavin-dependent oxidoreductase (nitroreductase family)
MAADVGTEAGPGLTTKEFNRALIEAFRANHGVVPGELHGAKFLLLTTTGAKSGAKRTTPLVYHRIGERLLVIASTGGGPRNPGWFDNLAKNPSVRVELGDGTWEGRAVVLSGAERDALFAAVVKASPTFGRYQERTQRTIPVVELLPAET